jgi:two-component system, chemotaxis family, sensor kinase CheA
MSENSLLQDFITETGEHLEQTERNLLRLEQQPGDAGLLNEIFRSIHTIKGSSEYLGMDRIAELSHKLEGLLDQVRRGERSVDRGVIDLLIDTNDRLGALIADLQHHGSEQAAIDDLIKRIDVYVVGAADNPVPGDGADVEAYEDEYDEELFGIFVEQLKDGLQALAEEAQRLGTGESVETVLERCADRLGTLRSSANYMGYEHLKKQYEQWMRWVSEYRGRKSSGTEDHIEVRNEIIANIERVKSLFPTVKILEEVRLPEVSKAQEGQCPQHVAQAEPELALFSEGADINPEPVSVAAQENLEAVPEPENGLLSDFITETGEHLEQTERNLLRLEQQPGDAGLLNEIFRSIHTIKGSSEYLGMDRIAELSHKLEGLLDQVRRGERSVDRGVIDLLIDTNDRLGALIADLQHHGSEQAAIDDLTKRIDVYVVGAADNPVPGDGADVEAYEDEYDEELFGIFVEQLKDGLQALAEEAQRLGTGESVETVLERCADRLGTLRSSANYMGYEHLKKQYEQWMRWVSEYRGRKSSGTEDHIEVRNEIIANIERVKSLFPTVKILEEVRLPEVSKAQEGQCPQHVAQAEPELALFSEGADINPEPVSVAAQENLEAVPEPENGLLSDFITETGEHLEQTERNLLRLEQQPGDAGLLNEIFRSIHTIKGSSEYLGMDRIAELSHKLEGLLDQVRRGERSVDRGVIDLLIDTNDRLGALIADLQHHGSEQAAIDDLLGRIESNTVAPTTISSISSDELPMRHSSVYEEPYDKELFEIFKEHLESGLQAIEKQIVEFRSGSNTEAALLECLDQLTRLRSSANYMEYDPLCSFYDEWKEKLENTRLQSEDQTLDIDDFVKNVIENNLHFVRSMFKITIESYLPIEDKSEASETQDQIEIFQDDPLSQKSDQDLQDKLFSQLENAFAARLGNYSENQESSYSTAIEHELLSADLSTDYSAYEQSAPVSENSEQHPFETLLFTGSEPVVENIQSSAGGLAGNSDPEPAKFEDVNNEDRRRSFRFGRRQSDKSVERIQKNSIRVDASKIDVLMNQVGELVVNRAGFAQLINDMRALQLFLKQTQKLNRDEMQQIKMMMNRISDATLTLGRVTSELQENVMKVRMLPIAQLFSRYPRLIHDLVRSMNKKVDLEVLGEETELDKMIIEQIADPLVHIIRNAVDHGIEEIEERRRKGKDESGKLRLEAYHEGNFVVIEISDDGRGIDPAKIKTFAIEKGFASDEELKEMNDQEILTLIMRPGFSTAEQITHTSGRGVGMDVVKDYIDKINGVIEIISTLGNGTCFRIKIPLTLAIIPALLVRVDEDIYTIPLANVDETIRVRPSEISTIEGLEIYYLRETTIPLIRLTQIFNMPETIKSREDLFVVIINAGTKRVGLIVDELRAREEVVIKPLEDYLQEKSGFAGATILGDGSISLILDVFELVNLSISQRTRRPELTSNSI